MKVCLATFIIHNYKQILNLHIISIQTLLVMYSSYDNFLEEALSSCGWYQFVFSALID